MSLTYFNYAHEFNLISGASMREVWDTKSVMSFEYDITQETLQVTPCIARRLKELTEFGTNVREHIGLVTKSETPEGGMVLRIQLYENCIVFFEKITSCKESTASIFVDLPEALVKKYGKIDTRKPIKYSEFNKILEGESNFFDAAPPPEKEPSKLIDKYNWTQLVHETEYMRAKLSSFTASLTVSREWTMDDIEYAMLAMRCCPSQDQYEFRRAIKEACLKIENDQNCVGLTMQIAQLLPKLITLI